MKWENMTVVTVSKIYQNLSVSSYSFRLWSPISHDSTNKKTWMRFFLPCMFRCSSLLFQNQKKQILYFFLQTCWYVVCSSSSLHSVIYVNGLKSDKTAANSYNWCVGNVWGPPPFEICKYFWRAIRDIKPEKRSALIPLFPVISV